MTRVILRSIAVLAIIVGSTAMADNEEPALPDGLEESSDAEPALPMGLEDQPQLPEGLLQEPVKEKEKPPEITPKLKLPFDLTGFWEIRAGVRTQVDPYQHDASLGETRLQLELEKNWTATSFKITTDFLYDHVFDHHSRINLDEARGWLDLREASFSFTPVEFMDVKLGRQILTWGTGDLIFINDLFPKDWNSFFIGRDQEYLKAPSDAIKVSLYGDLGTLDFVYTPSFDADRFIDGRRISYWNTMLDRIAGQDAIIRTDKPNRWFRDDEFACRIYKNISGWELALYGYKGFWKSPAGMDPLSGRATFPKLNVYGGSVRGKVGRGIGHLEAGYYDSRDDSSGNDPFVRNDELRLLAGYEQELAKDFTVGVQYYLEQMMDYGDYRRSLSAGTRAADECRHVITIRLTKLLLEQNLAMSLFTFYSPSDRDAYLRPKISYKIDDHRSVELGGNVFLGEDDHTFFGQFSRNSNIYVSLRYSF